MVLSRFWLAIFISSIVFIVLSLITSNAYSVDYILNGKKDDPMQISEKYLEQLPVFIRDSIQKAPEKTSNETNCCFYEFTARILLQLIRSPLSPTTTLKLEAWKSRSVACMLIR